MCSFANPFHVCINSTLIIKCEMAFIYSMLIFFSQCCYFVAEMDHHTFVCLTGFFDIWLGLPRQTLGRTLDLERLLKLRVLHMLLMLKL